MLRLGALGFGGPVALVGYVHRDRVENRQWITDADYREGLELSQLAPGPLAAHLAIDLCYLHYRVLGATLKELAFVVGIIAMSAKKLTEKRVGKDKLLRAIYLLLAAVTIATESEVAWLFVATGVFVWFWRAPPKLASRGGPYPRAVPALAAPADTSLLTQIRLFFPRPAPSCLARAWRSCLSWRRGHGHYWLTEKQFLDAVAVARITPGRSSSRLPSSASRQTGRDIPYKNIPEADYANALKGAGLPEEFAAALASFNVGASQGALFDDSRQLSKLIGHPTPPLSDSVKQVVIQ